MKIFPLGINPEQNYVGFHRERDQLKESISPFKCEEIYPTMNSISYTLSAPLLNELNSFRHTVNHFIDIGNIKISYYVGTPSLKLAE